MRQIRPNVCWEGQANLSSKRFCIIAHERFGIQMRDAVSARVVSSLDIIIRNLSADCHREASKLSDLMDVPIGPLLRMFFILHDTSTSNDLLINLPNSPWTQLIRLSSRHSAIGSFPIALSFVIDGDTFRHIALKLDPRSFGDDR